MKTIPRNEELNASVERTAKRLDGEFINRCVERHKQEQAQQSRQDIEASAEIPRQATESADK